MAHPQVAPLSPVPSPTKPDETPKTFAQVFEEELGCINHSRELREVKTTRATEDTLIGLAFSGGGIRSATFNLGILQALAEKHLLHKFDYLSTVSGGGYIGGWLAGVIHRFKQTLPHASVTEIEAALSPEKYETQRRNERSFLHWLRLYSNYLTPHTGLLSGDTWAMIGTWMRNVLLNQTVLAFLFVGIFVLCYGDLFWQAGTRENAEVLLMWGAGVLFLASLLMGISVVQREDPEVAGKRRRPHRITVIAVFMLLFVISAALLNCGLWQFSFGLWRWFDLSQSELWQWALAGAGFYFVVWGIVGLLELARRRVRRREPEISVPALVIFSPLAGAAGACLLKAYHSLLGLVTVTPTSNWAVLVFGTGAVMAVLLITGSLHLGLVGRGSRDMVREWWARLGGYMMLVTLVWLVLAGTCAFGPLLVRWIIFKIAGWASISAVLLWIVNNYLGLKAGNSAVTSGQAESASKKAKAAACETDQEAGMAAKITQKLKSPNVLDVVAKAAPYVFAVGLVFLFATAVHFFIGLYFNASETEYLWRLSHSPANTEWNDLSGTYWAVQESGLWQPAVMVGVLCLIAAAFLSWRVDINDFSLHHFYRNRLVRCYLGASNPNCNPQRFTRFDPDDDLPLSSLARNHPGPFPLVNAALNITSGEELGYATRRAKSFVFTPLYCGYEKHTQGEGNDRFLREHAYVPTFSRTVLGRSEGSAIAMGCDQGVSLGTAMAISGAAASPNMGYFTSPVTALFMTLFDVRLGWWMGNPRYPHKWKTPGPKLGLGYLLSELLGESDQNKSYVYLSDGGHFENLAAYELLKRHCQLIVACDADCDPAYRFENLLGLIEKARTDFGAKIEINYEQIRAQNRESGANFVIGDISYDPQNPNDKGTLIYIKTSMPQREPIAGKVNALPDDVWHYFDQHKTFPHQSTADQWFDEPQFESYRALGEFIGQEAAGVIGDIIAGVLGERARPAAASD